MSDCSSSPELKLLNRPIMQRECFRSSTIELKKKKNNAKYLFKDSLFKVIGDGLTCRLLWKILKY